MKTTAKVLASIVALALLALPVQATTIHVPDGQPTIQDGINAASAGDTVLVACGTYYEYDIVMKSGVCLTSETGQADCVTIDAQFADRVMYCEDADQTSSIEGFTMARGYGYHGGGSVGGGGLLCERSSPRVTNCRLSQNDALNGGGMWCIDGSNPTVTNCEFTANHAFGGGGVALSSSSPTFTDCVFTGNSVFGGGGGMACTSSSSPMLVRCTFSENHNHEDEGGGISCYSSSSPTLTNCIVAFSTPGEAIYCSASGSATLTCCDVYGNAGGDWVGCIADEYGVDGNFSADPLFCGDLNPDEPYTLHTDSPCAPDNNPECGLIGAWGVGCGLTAVEPVSWGAIKAMFQ